MNGNTGIKQRTVLGLLLGATLLAACGFVQEFSEPEFTQAEYDEVAQLYLDCIETELPEATASTQVLKTYPGGEELYAYDVGIPVVSDRVDDVDGVMGSCETEVSGFLSVSSAWELVLVEKYPDAFEDIEFERVVECLRSNGLAVPDTSTASLDAAIAADRTLYFECYDAESDRVRRANEPKVAVPRSR